MSIITANSVLSNVVLQHTALLPLLNRFGIKLGLGDETVQSICQKQGLDQHFFIYVANSYIQPSYTGCLKLSAHHLSLIVDYLERANSYYLHAQIPNVRIHLMSFVKRSGCSNPILQELPRILSALENLLEERVSVDQKEYFPRFQKLAKDIAEKRNDSTLDQVFTEEISVTKSLDEGDDRLESLVEDVMQVLIRHIKGDFDDNLLHGVIYSLAAFRADISNNNRLRKKVFFPMVHRLEEYLHTL